MFVAGASSSGVGYAKVYKWNGSAWAQEGSTIDGLSSGDDYGWITLSSDGKRYLVSAQTNNNSGVDVDEFKCIARVLHWCILLLFAILRWSGYN